MKLTLPKLVIAALIVWLIAIYSLFGLFALNSGEAKVQAMFGVVSGLVLLWVAIIVGFLHPVSIHFPPI